MFFFAISLCPLPHPHMEISRTAENNKAPSYSLSFDKCYILLFLKTATIDFNINVFIQTKMNKKIFFIWHRFIFFFVFFYLVGSSFTLGAALCCKMFQVSCSLYFFIFPKAARRRGNNPPRAKRPNLCRSSPFLCLPQDG